MREGGAGQWEGNLGVRYEMPGTGSKLQGSEVGAATQCTGTRTLLLLR